VPVQSNPLQRIKLNKLKHILATVKVTIIVFHHFHKRLLAFFCVDVLETIHLDIDIEVDINEVNNID
jgi:hypothetical protein